MSACFSNSPCDKNYAIEHSESWAGSCRGAGLLTLGLDRSGKMPDLRA